MEGGPGCVEPVGSCKDFHFYSGYNKLFRSYEHWSDRI